MIELTNVGGDASQDDLLLACGFYSGAEVGVVPGIDFALALDVRRIGIHLGYLLWKGTIGT